MAWGKQHLEEPQDLGIFDRHVYEQMKKWYPNQSFNWYIEEIIYLFQIYYI